MKQFWQTKQNELLQQARRRKVDEQKRFDQEEEMRQVHERLHHFITQELEDTSEPHIVGGVLAAALQNLWLALMGPEAAATAFRHVAKHVESGGDPDAPPDDLVLTKKRVLH
jgi:hypothetical protein